jgi:hypothetical protein
MFDHRAMHGRVFEDVAGFLRRTTGSSNSSPYGRTIYFLRDQGSFFNVWGIRFDPDTGNTVGDPFRVTALDSPGLRIPGYMGNVEISISRKNLVVSVGQLSGSIWVLDNVDR